MGRIYMTRHGETVWNLEGRIQGHTDIDLSPYGRSQAKALSDRLSDVHFDAVYSSDLARARETAEIIVERKSVDVHPTELLREYHKGVFEGLTVSEYKREFPELYAASLVNDLDFAPTGGETIRETSVRMAGFISHLKQEHMNDTVLVVGHGGSLRSAVVAILDLPLEANWKLIMNNCALSIFDVYPDNSVMALYNDTSHMKGTIK